jgi:hypothetical protein
MICKRCGVYAVAKQKSIIGATDVERVIRFMTGEEKDTQEAQNLKIAQMDYAMLQNVQFRPEELYQNALITTIASNSIDRLGSIRNIASDISETDIINKWGAYGSDADNPAGRLVNFQGELRNAINSLLDRGIIKKIERELTPFYILSVDLFRRWWNVKHPVLNNELDKLVIK